MITVVSDISLEIGRLLMEWREEKKFNGKWEGAQFKAEVDLMVHRFLSDKLTEAFPNIPVLSEEDPDSFNARRPSRYWLIDPIDGTASFVHGYDGFVTQIALMEDGVPTMAVVYAPVFKQLFLAERGEGAWCNNKRLYVAQNEGFRNIIDNYPEPQGITAKIFDDFQINDYIESGSISLKICRVAEGVADLFIKDVVVRDWDLAAPQLILEEAGGYIAYLNGDKLRYSGLVEHEGLVATSSEKKCNTVVAWYQQIEKD